VTQHPTSVQEIIDKPLPKAAGSKKSKFSAHGREDIDARCLDYRPFVIELLKPARRKIDSLIKIDGEYLQITDFYRCNEISNNLISVSARG
jgi:tRNA U54 and U55 pseudouridine synthase Pus10